MRFKMSQSVIELIAWIIHLRWFDSPHKMTYHRHVEDEARAYYVRTASIGRCGQTFRGVWDPGLDRPFEFAREAPWNAPSMVDFAGANPWQSDTKY